MSVIPYGRQQVTAEDVEAVKLAVQAPFLTQGPGVAEFEGRLAELVGARYAVAMNSGTAALHAAYAAAGLQVGERVVTTPITFAATANASRYLGGDVRFVDVDPVNILLDPAGLVDGLRTGERIVTPVHFGGAVAPMERLRAVADSSGAMVVEDAAHSLGSRYLDAAGHEYSVGSCRHSEMACFSFHPVKHITTGEGGAVTTNDRDLYRRLLRFRTHGITREPSELSLDEGPWYYEQHELGFNYRIPDLNTALGLSQLSRLDQMVQRRRYIAALYDEAFASVPGVEGVPDAPWSRSSYHLYVIRVDPLRRRGIFEALRQRGLGVNVHYLPVYRHPYYQRTGFAGFSLPEAERYYASAISIPMYPDLTDAQIDHVIATVRDVVAQASWAVG
jgi:UDP-4-amino-4,6-dideoxy-N-acetyl-beta-L-altrosamine transaminase